MVCEFADSFKKRFSHSCKVSTIDSHHCGTECSKIRQQCSLKAAASYGTGWVHTPKKTNIIDAIHLHKLKTTENQVNELWLV